MKIAIIGSGLAGLGAAFYLTDHDVSIFYDLDGASMAASGLMHKFVGSTGHKSFRADEAFQASSSILQTLGGSFYHKTPLIRQILSDEMGVHFKLYEPVDIEFIGQDRIVIKEGMAIDVPSYLKALRGYLEALGVRFYQQKIASLEELTSYDRVIVAAGYGIKELAPRLKMKYLKGQSLVFANQHRHTLPLIAQGYLVPLGEHVIIGSSYQKVFSSPLPDEKEVYRYLADNLKTYFQPYDQLNFEKILSGVRVAHPNVNHPKLINLDERTLIVTGLGSRGLLYHALIGKLITTYLEEGLQDPPFF